MSGETSQRLLSGLDEAIQKEGVATVVHGLKEVRKRVSGMEVE